MCREQLISCDLENQFGQRTCETDISVSNFLHILKESQRKSFIQILIPSVRIILTGGLKLWEINTGFPTRLIAVMWPDLS